MTRAPRCGAAVCAALLVLGAARAQVRAPGTAMAGGTITVEVGSNDATVEVAAAGSADVASHDVGPDRTVTVPVPSVPSGTILFVSVGRGLRARIVLVEVIRP